MKRSLSILVLVMVLLPLHGQENNLLARPVSLTGESGILKPVTVTVVYDNYAARDGLKPDWGYSLFIEGLEKNILFDAGASPEIFKGNFRRLKIDSSRIDILVLSHEHGDHTAGMPAFAAMRKNIPAIFPGSFSAPFRNEIARLGFDPVPVTTPSEICTNLYSSGEFGGSIPEQALVLDTRPGLVVITGCSHPGITGMLRKIRNDFGKNIYMVFGGFHLLQKSDAEMERIILEMKQLGVEKCGATHCTGERQTAMIKEAFGTGFIPLGAGNTLTLE